MNPLLLLWPFLVFQVVTANAIRCQARKPASYSFSFLAEWNSLSFPKQYPTHRPPAQWSMLFGCVHNYDFTLWAEGAVASSGVKMFVEDGKHETLLEEVNATLGTVQSWFHTNPIIAGEGNSSTLFTVTPTHPLVSFLVRIIPSPDWFLGANSINLCENNTWKESYTLDLFPWDAGTDSGFTFSSPNFATNPQETIFQITAKRPSHPANSFYYPRLEALPRMGHAEFTLRSTVSSSQAPGKGPEQTQATQGRKQNLVELPQVNWTFAENETKADVVLFKADDVFNDVLEKPLKKEAGNSQEKDFPGTPLDCEVSVWSSWGLCSHSCGIGTREKTRFIVQHPANDGETCPTLLIQEECEESPCPTPVADSNVTVSDPAEGTAMTHFVTNLNESIDSNSLEEPWSQHNETGGEPENITAVAHSDTIRVQESNKLLKFTNKSQGDSEAGTQPTESPPAFRNASTDQFFTNLTSTTTSEGDG
ncbi:spondin-2-like [Heterodontus francisci]|uniref:spondin-2-like n=1 Tax=Heterodontus francisci TaxID=7792 RepID=UPI00355AD544